MRLVEGVLGGAIINRKNNQNKELIMEVMRRGKKTSYLMYFKAISVNVSVKFVVVDVMELIKSYSFC